MSGEKLKRGRPKKHIDLEMVERLAHIQCTYGEIASTLGVSVDTLQRHKDFAVVYKRGAEGGRKSLRRMQFESANRGNVVMQIWLGKQYLGQSDHVTSEVRRLPPLRELSVTELNEVLRAYTTKYPELADEADVIETPYTVVKDPARSSRLLTSEEATRNPADVEER